MPGLFVAGTLRRFATIALVTVAVVPAAGARAAELPGTRYAADSFARHTTDGWGRARVGGDYTLEGPSGDFDVDGTAGTIRLPSAGARRSARLASLSASHVDLAFTVSSSSVSRGGAQYMYAIVRHGRHGENTYETRPRIRIATSGLVYAGVDYRSGDDVVGGGEAQVPGIVYEPNLRLRVRARLAGGLAFVKAWRAGTPEPAGWPYRNTTSLLPETGAVGLGAFLEPTSTNAPVTVAFRDFVAGSPSPGPVGGASITYAADRFEPPLVGSRWWWGTPAVGSEWDLGLNRDAFEAPGAMGTIELTRPGQQERAYVRTAPARDVEVNTGIAADRVPTGGSLRYHVMARHAAGETDSAYRLVVSVRPDQTIRLRVMRHDDGDISSITGDVAVAGAAFVAHNVLRVRAQFVGTYPTRISAKVWPSGHREPVGWHLQASDSTPILQQPGPSFALGAELSSGVTNAPVIVGFDDFFATSPGGLVRTVPGSSASSCVGGWRVTDPPGSELPALQNVTVSPNGDVFAVGNVWLNAFGQGAVFAEWRGDHWEATPGPGVGLHGSYVQAIAASSADRAWAVGRWADRYPYRSLILSWNGSRWRAVPAPTAGSGSELYAVSALTDTDAWAVGSFSESQADGARTLVAHWDGVRWSRVPSPNATDSAGNPVHTALWGVAALASDDVWAVGSRADFPNWRPIAMRWDGVRWSFVPLPEPLDDAGDRTGFLGSVAGSSRTDVWAVGHYDPSSGTSAPLALHWNGSAWSRVPVSPPDTTVRELSTVAAVSRTQAWAIGHDDTQQFLVRWNGTGWSRVASPADGDHRAPLDIAAKPGGALWTVGGERFAEVFVRPLAATRC